MILVLCLYFSTAALVLYIVWQLYANVDICIFAKKVHGPPVLPMLGNSYKLFGQNNILSVLNTIFQNFPPPTSIWIGCQYGYWTNNSEEINDILTNQHTVNKGWEYNFLRYVLGNSLTVIEEKTWRLHRKLLGICFNQDILNGFVPIFYKKSCQLSIELGLTEDEDIIPIFLKATANMYFETIGVGSVADLRIAKKSLGLVETMSRRIHNPIYHFDFIYFLTSDGRKLKGTINYLKQYTRRVVYDKKLALQKCSKKKIEDIDNQRAKSILQLLLEDGVFSDDQIVDELWLFGAGAAYGTKSTLVFCCILLSMYPNIQSELYEEVVDVIGTNGPLEHHHLPNLNLTERVILETLRLFPVTPVLTRHSSADVTIGSKVVPKGCDLKIFVFDLHRNEKYWPDPLKFDPNRFLPEEIEKRDPYSYLAFSTGPRDCLGKKYAIMLLKTALAALVRKFRITSDYIRLDELGLTVDIVLTLKDNVRCKFTARN